MGETRQSSPRPAGPLKESEAEMAEPLLIDERTYDRLDAYWTRLLDAIVSGNEPARKMMEDLGIELGESVTIEWAAYFEPHKQPTGIGKLAGTRGNFIIIDIQKPQGSKGKRVACNLAHAIAVRRSDDRWRVHEPREEADGA